MHGAVFVAAEFHDAQQQHCGLARLNFPVEIFADGTHRVERVEVFTHFIDPAHVAVEVQVGIDVANAEVMTQIAHEHGLCPCLIYLFFLAKQGKQA